MLDQHAGKPRQEKETVIRAWNLQEELTFVGNLFTLESGLHCAVDQKCFLTKILRLGPLLPCV